MTAIKLPELPHWLQDDADAMFVICGLHPEQLRNDFRAYAQRAVRMNAEVLIAELWKRAKEHEIKADRPHQDESNTSWHMGMSEAFDDAADLIAALTHQEAHHGN